MAAEAIKERIDAHAQTPAQNERTIAEKSEAPAAAREASAADGTARCRHRMPPFPAFEAPGSYAKYAEGDANGVYAAVSASAGSMAVEADSKEPAPEVAAPDEPSLESRVDAVVTCVCSQEALREVLYKTLAHCVEPRLFDEVESFVASQDEFVYSHIIQTPFTLIQMLVRAGGLSETPLDGERNPLSDDAFEGLSADEADDIVATYELATTDAGREALDLLSPQRRFASQLAQKPHRARTFFAVLDFCREPRTFPEIQEFFKQTPDLVLDRVQANHVLSPDYYVDRLEKAGMIVWRKAWVATDAGRQALAERSSAPDSE